MKIKTRLFGEIETDDAKNIYFENGLMGFENCRNFLLIHDAEKSGKTAISWLQSIEEPDMAITVMDPLKLLNYDPVVEDELLKSIGDLSQNELLVLVTLTIPSDITKMTANLKAPIVVNAATYKGCQLIVENDEYKVKHPVYQYFKAAGRKDGE